MAAGTVLPQEVGGFFFNHHPEKKREPRATDKFLTSLESVAEFSGVIPAMPAACDGRYQRALFATADFRATRTGARWHPMLRGWGQLPIEERYLRSKSYPPPLSPFAAFGTHQNTNSFGLGCTTAGRIRFKLEVVDEANGVTIARRYAEARLPVDSWFQARCLGRFSIQESARAHSCGERLLGTSRRAEPTQWGVKVLRVGCDAAARIAERALRLPAILRGSVAAQSLEGWRCYFGHRGAASCNSGARHVFMLARGNDSLRCESGPRKDGVARLNAAGVPCDVALGLVTFVRGQPATDLELDLSASGQSWSCIVSRYLGEDDLFTNRYACFSAAALVTFELSAPETERQVPSLPTVVPPDVEFAPAGLLGFPRTPRLRFDYQKWRKGRMLLPLEAEEVLVGRRARLKIVAYTQRCLESADPSEDYLFCYSRRMVGRPVTRSLTLQPTQLVNVGRLPRHGNWEYRITATTRPFIVSGIAFEKAVAVGYAGVNNDVEKCPSSPLCNKHR